MSPKEIRSLIDRARRSLKSSQRLLDDGDHDFAMSRAYYAMFYAASAALISVGVKRSKHSGVIAAFGQNLVKPGLIPFEHHAALQAAFADRSEAEYGAIFPSREAVEGRLRQAAHFVDVVQEMMREQGLDTGETR